MYKKTNVCLNLIKFGQNLGQILGKNRKKSFNLIVKCSKKSFLIGLISSVNIYSNVIGKISLQKEVLDLTMKEGGKL